MQNKNIDFIIYSDEAGTWDNSAYYIRSWVKISVPDYNLLLKEVLFLKHVAGISALKWSNFKNSSDEFKDIFNIDFKVFITISIPSHLSKKLYKALQTVARIPAKDFTGDWRLKVALKRKAINSLKHTLFFNIYERQHIENAKSVLVNDTDPSKYKFVIDSPQCLNKNWREIANSAGVSKVEFIARSEDEPGIQLADIIAGCIQDMTRNNRKARRIYQQLIKDKMVDMYSEDYPNPNLIFSPTFTDREKRKLQIFR